MGTSNHPYESAGLLSKLFFCWIFPILKRGYKRDLHEEDVSSGLNSYACETLGLQLEKEWKKELEKKNKKPNLLYATIRFLGIKWYTFLLLQLLLEIAKDVGQPLVLYFFLKSVENSQLDKQSVFWAASILCLLVFIMPVIMYQLVFTANRLGQTVGTAIAFLNYQKCLRLNSGACGNYSVGQILNLQTNDLRKLVNTMNYIAQVITGPAGILCGVVVLYPLMGVSSLAGFVVILLMVPFQLAMGRYNQKKRQQLAEITDERTRLTREFIQGIRPAKMFGWVSIFENSIRTIRKAELSTVRRMFIQKCLVHATSLVTGHLMFFVAFLTAAWLGRHLPLEVIFMSLAIYNSIGGTMFFCFPFGLLYGAEAISAFNRLQEFLLQPEVGTANEKVLKSSSKPYVRLQNVTASWSKDAEEAILDVSVFVKRGELLVVAGPVASGKSSLLMTIQGECDVIAGQVKRRGRLAYVPAEAWLISATIRENILLYRGYDPDKYDAVIRACALNKDLKTLPFGDLTLVGEDGIQLSGGQKARINLARALYLEADIYLLDDPFSAVDSSVAHHIFQQCINLYLKDKVCILATHQLQYLQDADKVLIMKNGKVYAFGGHEVIRNVDLSNISTSSSATSSPELRTVKKVRHRSSTSASRKFSRKSHGHLQIPFAVENGLSVTASLVYWKYVKAMGGPIAVILLVLLFSTNQSLYTWMNFWFLHWTISSCFENITTCNETSSKAMFVFEEFQSNVLFYSFMTMSNALLCFICVCVLFSCCAHASFQLHDVNFKKIAAAPVEFFDNNHDCGKLLNSFTNDMGIVDEDLPAKLTLFMQTLFRSLGVLTVGVIFNPWMTLPVLLMLCACAVITRMYFKTSRCVKKIERRMNGPLLSHLSSTMQGLTVIRAFKVEDIFSEKFFCKQNSYVASSFTFFGLVRWFSLYLHFFSVLYVIIVVWMVVFIATGHNLTVLPAYAVASSLELSIHLQKSLRTFTELDGHMTSVERILKYEHLTSEQTESEERTKPKDPEWPRFGDIHFNNVSVKYPRTSSFTLKNITFRIYPGEKIGIVGRTGAGKSSLLASLFRLVEVQGAIAIDEIDISKVDLNYLRKQLSIIPQDPVLFSGTVRSNLDPWKEFADYRIWQVLEDVQLKKEVEHLEKGLDTEILEGGQNLSTGQRQLICLGRAILTNNRILVLDEATANVDPKTDDIIQKIIRKKFEKCTVLSIAHRIQTVMDCDRVMVLEGGRMVEFSSVSSLLQDPNSKFSRFVKDPKHHTSIKHR